MNCLNGRHRMDLRGLITEDNRKWWTLGAMCLSMFMTMLDSGVVNVALPSIQKDLHTTVDQLEWVVNGYTLSFAALLVTSGRPGDIFCRRLIFDTLSRGRLGGFSRDAVARLKTLDRRDAEIARRRR